MNIYDQFDAAPPAPNPYDQFDTGHPVSGPTGNTLVDLGRRAGSAALNAWSGLASLIPQTGIGINPDTNRLEGAPVQDDNVRVKALKDAAYNLTGATEYIPQTEAGRLVQAGLEGAIAAPLTGGGTLTNALGGVGAQAAVEHLPLPPVAAALLGQFAGGYGAHRATRAAAPLLPGRMDPETTALARRAINDYGITVPLAKAGNNPFIRYADSMLRKMPFSGYGPQDAANQSAFNRGAATSFGEAADKITPNVLNRAYGRIGGVFDDVAQRTPIQFDQKLLQDLSDIHQQAGEVGLDQGQVNSVRGHVDKLQNIAVANNGIIPGDVYQNLTKKGESLDLLQGNRSTVAGNLGGAIRDALDEALQRSAAPEDVAALREARAQYKALKTVEPLTMRADTPGGATPSTGDISPAALLGRVTQQYANAPRAGLGDIPLKDLAQIGQRFLKEPGSSGTAERMNVKHLMELGGTLGGALVGGHELGMAPLEMMPPLAAALLAPRVAGSILRNPSFVANRVNGVPFNPEAQILAAQLRAQPSTLPLLGP